MARKIQVELIGDASQLDKVFGKAGRSASGFESSLNKASIGAAAALGALGLGAKAAFGEFTDAEKIGAQTAAALKSTGGAANVTQSHIEDLAGSLLNLSGVDDEAIQSGENLLLTFTNIKNVAGQGNDIFDQTTKTMLDMSVALGQDTKSSALQLGKALNDPIRGVTALQRVGVSFTEQQREQIKVLVEHGNTLDAQKLILGELSKEFGGSAQAAGETFSGQLEKAKQQALNFSAELVSGAIPALTGLAGGLLSATQFMSEHKELTKVLIGVVAGLAGAVLAVNAAVKLWSAATTIMTAAQWLLNAVLAANPLVLVAGLVIALGAALVVAYNKSETFRNIVNGAFDAVKTTIKGVADFVTVKLPAAFQGVKDWVSKHWPEIATLISGPFAPIVALATNAFGVRSALTGALGAIKSAASDRIDDVVGFFRALPGRIAGFAESVGTTFVSKLGDGLSSLGKKLRELVAGPLNALIGAWNDLGIPSFGVHIKLPGPAPDINFDFGGVSLPDIPKLAAGGIVTAPTLALIGEAGPEAVIPLGAAHRVPSAPSGAGGGRSVTINISAPRYLGTREELIRELGPAMNRYLRRNGIPLGGTA